MLVFRDVSEEYHRREQMERRHNLSYELLGILNSSAALPDMINAVILAIKRWTGFDAVGIRLQAGDDFPYFSQIGFSDDFLLTEIHWLSTAKMAVCAGTKMAMLPCNALVDW